MKRFVIIMLAVLCVLYVDAAKYNYTFKKTPIPEALAIIAEQHSDIHINFIYDELDSYKTSAVINTDDIYEALREIIRFNPISINVKDDYFYIEALQQGRYEFSGKVVDENNEPLVGVSVVILTPRDSTVITYGITDDAGQFLVPCDKKKILMKFSCVGYTTTYIDMPGFSVGQVKMSRLPIKLSTVTVEADNTVLASDKNTYLPTTRQKDASQDAIDLLRRMAIPQLVIGITGNSVKDVFGNSVPIYINYYKAEDFDIKGMKMSDVRKVEYYENPTDPRFNGADRVVNIVVQEYEYGGYTKASQSTKTLNGLDNNSEVFSKFTYKKMTYDVFVGSRNKNFHHLGEDNMEQYHLENRDNPMTVNRDEKLTESHNRSNEYPITFRTTYNTQKFSNRNTLSFTHYSAPIQNSGGDLRVDFYPDKDYTYFRSTPNKHNYVYYNGSFNGVVGDKIAYDINPMFNHTHRNNVSSYNSTIISSPINNYITENAYEWAIQATGRMVFKQKHQLFLLLGGGQNIYNLNYSGNTNAEDDYCVSNAGGKLTYRFQARRYFLSTYLGLVYNHNSINNVINNEYSPRIGVDGVIPIAKKSQLQGSVYYQSFTPSIDLKANDIVQSNEFMYLTGNPNLRDWGQFVSNLVYNYFYNNSFSFAVYGGYEQNSSRVVAVYLPYDDGQALLRGYINDGRFNRGYVGLSVNCKLFKNCLQLSGNLDQNFYDITGSYKESLIPPLRIQLQGIYYWKAFNILAAWGNPQHVLTENSNFIIKRRSFYVFSAGWGNGVWTVNMSANNIFNKGWLSETWKRNVPLYSQYKQVYNPSIHRNISLSITYTIGYGKKVQRGNEVQGMSSNSSAIIN